MTFAAHRRRLSRGVLVLCAMGTTPVAIAAQRDARLPAAAQGFASADCRQECSLDSLVIEMDRARRGQPGSVTASMLLIDTVALARRGAPPAPKERTVPVYVTCDSLPCAAAMVTARLSDKRLDDARVVRRTQLSWPLPAPLLLRVPRTAALVVSVDGKAHPVSTAALSATKALAEAARSGLPSTPYSPRMQLYIATFAAFGVPGDSTMAEDVGTATEPLMIPDATTTMPTRVANLTLLGRGPDAMPLLVQDDATGAAPIFGVNEKLSVVLPGRTGRRGVVAATVVARQRVDALRDACQSMKVWVYLLSMSPADLQVAQRGMLSSPRPGEGIDRWNGTAVREPVAARLLPAEQRALTAARPVVAHFAKERAATGVRASDVQVLAALPKNGGYVTNFGVMTKDMNGNWRFPTFALRPATCP